LFIFLFFSQDDDDDYPLGLKHVIAFIKANKGKCKGIPLQARCGPEGG
jgi:penicillin-binding protein-related factor A (putative recombinase)